MGVVFPHFVHLVSGRSRAVPTMFSPSALLRLVRSKPAQISAQLFRHTSSKHRVRVLPGISKILSNPEHRSQEQLSELDLDKDAVEAKLEQLMNEEMRRWKATKFHKIKREMSSRGAPERKLTWDAIQQIRYLKQECPEEWSVKRLADSFSVSPDVVSRVLRTSFTPPPERRLKQDSRVLRSVRARLSPPEDATKQRARLLAPGGVVSAALQSENTAAPETGLVPSGGKVTSLKTVSSYASVKTWSQNVEKHDNGDTKDVERMKEEEEEEEEEEGVFLTEEELDQLVQTLQEKPSEVHQTGNEFFDSEGNFLYRI